MAQDCEALRKFRDEELVKRWDIAAAQFRITVEGKKDLEKLRQELISENTWKTSDWLVVTGVVAANTKATAQLVANLLKLVPQTGAVKGAVAAGSVTADRVLFALEKGDNILSIADDGLLKVAGKEFLGAINPVGVGVKAMWDLHDDVQKALYLPAQRDELRAIVKERLDALDDALAAYDKKIDQAAEKLAAINAVKEGIDAYCLKVAKLKALEGNWTSTDPQSRFSLNIKDGTCVWVERSASGATLSRTVPLVLENGEYHIFRANDETVLTFLGFQPSLRAEILAAGPQPSFIVLRASGTGLQGEWHGIVAIKDSNAKLKELKQPKTVPGKDFPFKK